MIRVCKEVRQRVRLFSRSEKAPITQPVIFYTTANKCEWRHDAACTTSGEYKSCNATLSSWWAGRGCHHHFKFLLPGTKRNCLCTNQCRQHSSPARHHPSGCD